MVIRIKKERKYLGARSWGAGNIKNRRGAGSRGGTGKGGIKHKFTHTVKYEKERVGSVGFSPWKKDKLKEINLDAIEARASSSSDGKLTLEMPGYKVLGGGKISRAVHVKASAFSKKAEERIKAAGGEAVKL
jgi:large subunit ribosomal protein L15